MKFKTISENTGSVVLLWGLAEHALDFVVAIIYQQFGGACHSKRLPKMLERKIIFLETCTNEIKELSPHKQNIDRILHKFKDLGTKRHDLIHGAISALSEENDTLVLSKFDFKKDIHELRSVHLSGQDFQVLKEDILRLAGETAHLSNAILHTLKELQQ